MGDKLKIEKDLGCGGKCCKLLLYAFNILFLVGGLALFAVGIWVAAARESNEVANIIETSLYKAAAYLLLISGACVCVVSLIGCCGAKFENRCLLGTYFVFLLVIFLFELVAGIIALACYTQAQKFFEDNMVESLKNNYGIDGKINVTKGWDYVQEKYECCGVNGTSDDAIILYSQSKWHTETLARMRVPKSCCHQIDDADYITECTTLGGDQNYINNKGCFPPIRDRVIQYATVLAGMGIAVCTIQIFGMIAACCMFRQLFSVLS